MYLRWILCVMVTVTASGHHVPIMLICFFPQIAFAMFGVYVLIDDKNVLDAQKVFVSMALINILKTPLSQLPFAMSTTMQVKYNVQYSTDQTNV